MKKFFLFLVLLLIPATVHATVTKVIFSGYTSASAGGTVCTVWGMKSYQRDVNNVVLQVFTPDLGLTRSYTSGTKGIFGRYSTNIGYSSTDPFSKIRAIKFTCVNSSGTASPVKVYLDSTESYFLTLSDSTIGVAP